jgi:transcriptional regulator with XRE-family HTH domain
MISKNSQAVLTQMGHHIKNLRIKRNDRQSDFAARLGVSIPTLRKLESGDPTVAIGTWIDALWLLGKLDALKTALEPKQSLFDQWENHKKTQTRERASKK